MRSRPVRRCNADRKEREGYQRLLAAVFAPEPWEAPKLIERPYKVPFRLRIALSGSWWNLTRSCGTEETRKCQLK